MENKQTKYKPISIKFGLIQSTSFCVSISSNRTYITFLATSLNPKLRLTAEL